MRLRPKRIIKRVTHQWPAKIASVAVAVALWVYVLNQQDPVSTRSITVNIEPWNVAKGMELLSVEPDKLTLVLRGRQSLLDRAQENIQARVDLSNARVGSQEVVVQVVARPPGVEIVRMSRRKVRVVMDTSVAAKRPVIVDTRGLPAEGFRALAPSSEPATVTVRGPASLVARVAKVVATVDISGASATVSQQVDVEARDEAGLAVSGVRVEPDRVKVVVPLRRVNVKVVPVWPDLTPPAPGYRVASVTVRPAVVVLSGAPAALEKVQYVATETVDIGGLRRRATFSVRLRVPGGVAVVGAASAQVRVTVERMPEMATAPRPAPAESPQAPEETSGPTRGELEAKPAPAMPPTAPAQPPGQQAGSASQPAGESSEQ